MAFKYPSTVLCIYHYNQQLGWAHNMTKASPKLVISSDPITFPLSWYPVCHSSRIPAAGSAHYTPSPCPLSPFNFCCSTISSFLRFNPNFFTSVSSMLRLPFFFPTAQCAILSLISRLLLLPEFLPIGKNISHVIWFSNYYSPANFSLII